MSRCPAPDDLKRRILATFPAAHYAVDGLLRLLDVVLDDEVESAAVECRATPLLLLNPAFLERHCRADEHLLMLVMHEIHHVLLGHTRLFPRMTEAQNIAFDAVINAVLCQTFPTDPYRSFFESLNAADSFPACLLRPPPGWPVKSRPPKNLPDNVRELIRALYGEAGVGYAELFRLLEQSAQEFLKGSPTACSGGYVLLGDHGPEEGEEGRCLNGARSTVLLDSIRSIVEKWPMPANPIRGRSVGHELREALVGQKDSRKAAALLRRMFRRLTMQGQGRRTFWHPGETDQPGETPIPQLRDRRAIVRRLLGETPLFFRTELPLTKPIPRKAIVHVYLDVSGSTSPYQADLIAAVRPHVLAGRCVVHAFSEFVYDLGVNRVRNGKIRTTGGTNIACVTEHMVEHEVMRALVLTDGYVGKVPAEHQSWLSRKRVKIDIALTPNGWRNDLQDVTRHFVELPIQGG